MHTCGPYKKNWVLGILWYNFTIQHDANAFSPKPGKFCSRFSAYYQSREYARSCTRMYLWTQCFALRSYNKKSKTRETKTLLYVYKRADVERLLSDLPSFSDNLFFLAFIIEILTKTGKWFTRSFYNINAFLKLHSRLPFTAHGPRRT